MTLQRTLETSFEAESAQRLEAAVRYLASAEMPALRLELHRWRVALRAVGTAPPAALLRLERQLELATAINAAFELEVKVQDQPSGVLAQHRQQRAARAAGGAAFAQTQRPEWLPLEPALLESAPIEPAALERSSEVHAASDPAAQMLPSQPFASSRAANAITAAAAVVPETVRVPVAKLDALLALSGELRVAQIRACTRADQLRVLLNTMNAERRQWRKRLSDPAQLLERVRLQTTQAFKQLSALERQWALDNAQVNTVTRTLEDEVLAARLLPAALLLPPLERLVRDLSRQLGKRVRLNLSGADTFLDRKIIDGLRDPLMHMVRNALDHGFESPERRLESGKPPEGTLHLSVTSDGSMVTIDLSDDGAGIDTVAVQRRAVAKGLIAANHELSASQIRELIFEPGFSTAPTVTETSGRGVGMDVVRENVAQLGGQIALESTAGLGSRFIVRLPMQLATSRVLLVRLSASHLVAVPTRDLERTGRVKSADITVVGGSSAVSHSVQLEGLAVAFASLGGLIGVTAALSGDWLSYVVLNAGRGQRLACAVEALVSEQEVVMKRLPYPLQKAAHLSGAALLGSGELVPILNVAALLELHQHGRQAAPLFGPRESAPKSAAQRRRILVVDDSVTTRTLERSILEAAGFETRTAIDGLQALELLKSFNAELVLSDVEMPHLDGFGLTEQIRRNPRTQHVPVILVTSLDRPEHKERGARAGADAYIVKGEFNQQTLLETIGRLL